MPIAIVSPRIPLALLAGLLACDLAKAPAGVEAAAARPNIVVVLSDDQSWRDFGFMGSPIAKTPHLDSLAASGTVFTHAYTTASACRPSLQTLLTGLEPERIASLARELRRQRVPQPEAAAFAKLDTLPRVLGERGYVSFQGGKHWEGHFSLAGFDAGTALGFDEQRAEKTGVLYELAGGPGNELGRSTLEPLTDFLAARGDEPFLIWFAPMLPHTPHDPPPEYREPYAGAGLTPIEQGYFGNVSRLDARVGELLAQLEAQGLRERTLVVFLADNGWDATEEGGPVEWFIGGPRGKFSVHENGFRTPMIVSWPGRVPAGVRIDALVSALDLFPTLLDYAGVAAPPPGRSGLSLRPLIEGRGALARDHLVGGMTRLRPPASDSGKPTPVADVRDEPGYFVREPGWRSIFLPRRGGGSLYAIDEDPWERNDLAAAHPERLERHRAWLAQWRRRMREPAPIRSAAGAPAPATP